MLTLSSTQLQWLCWRVPTTQVFGLIPFLVFQIHLIVASGSICILFHLFVLSECISKFPSKIIKAFKGFLLKEPIKNGIYLEVSVGL